MGPCTLVLLLISVIVGLVYLYLSWNFNFWKKRGVNGPKPKLVYGSVPSIISQNRHMAFDLLDLYTKYKKAGEKFIGIFMTRNPQILVIDPKLARDILVSNFKMFRDNEPGLWVNRKIEKVSVKNPFMTLNAHWRETRSDVAGGLTANKIKQAYPIAMTICNKMIDYVKASIKETGNKLEVKDLCYRYTSEIVSDFIWGLNADTLKVGGATNPMLSMSQKLLATSFQSSGYYYITGLVPFVRKILNNRFYPEETDNFFSQVQKDALDMRFRNKNDRPDFLNYMIQLQEKKNISHFDMVGYSLTVLLDGFETSASATYHTLYYLAGNQSAQKKLREEIMANLGDDGELSYDVLTDIPYLDQCINETIRMITPIAIFSRMCSETTYLEKDDNNRVKIDPGMLLHIPVYAMHHDPDIFPDPEEYIPERFDNGRAKELNQMGYFFPFGDGPRICVGMKLGQLESKAGVVAIIKNFYLRQESKNPKYIDPQAFVLGLSGDLVLEFQPV